MLDRDWNVVYANAGAVEMLGVKELVGNNLWEALPEWVDSEVYEKAQYAVARQVELEVEGRLGQYGSPLTIQLTPSVGGLAVILMKPGPDTANPLQSDSFSKGTIQAERAPGEGSRFIIELPVRQDGKSEETSVDTY